MNQMIRCAYLDYIILNDSFNKEYIPILMEEHMLTISHQWETFNIEQDRRDYEAKLDFQTWLTTPIPFPQKPMLDNFKKYNQPVNLYFNVHRDLPLWLVSFRLKIEESDEALAGHLCRFAEYEPTEYVDLYMNRDT